MPEPLVARARERDHERTAAAISAALAIIGRSPDLAMRGFAAAVKKTAKSPQQEIIADFLRSYTASGHPGNTLIRNITRNLHPNVRRRFVAGMMANFFLRDPEFTERLLQERGISSPTTILISPSMRCNLKCVGCYAAHYGQEEDLTEEDVESIIQQGEAIGTRVYTILGGEPFVWRPLLDVMERHPQSVFLVFTNGTMITDKVADRLVEMGNVCPTISIEGSLKNTDARRGEGTYDRIMAAMDRLRERGVMIAFSATATRLNLDEIISDEFADLLVEKGCYYGWYFSYMPVGREPDLGLMPTPEERDKLRRGIMRIRSTKPLLVADFWGDGTLTGGCLAGGRKYIHINNKGDVEPCIFAHFATDNIKETPLLDALCSDFFRDFRRLQPFGRNLLRPCPIIDHPGIIKAVVERNGAHPTHDGAESLLCEFQPGLRQYAKGVRDVLDPVWQSEMPWAHRWLEADAEYQRREQSGRDAESQVEQEEKTTAAVG